MIQIEESNPSFESCYKCIYSDDSEETCILRRCIHAVSQLKECYVPKQLTIEPERKKGRWKRVSANKYTTSSNYIYRCSECGETFIGAWDFCANCGADMREPEDDIPMEYFESGGR